MVRLAKALATLRAQINELFPDRAKDWDGWIASANHHQQNPTSDHEARDFNDGNGRIVTAIDITHDPADGVDSYKLADWLLKRGDKRVKYIISNSRIGGGEGYAKRNGGKPWTWRRYSGANKHNHHVHVSVNGVKSQYDDARDWDLSGFVDKSKPKPAEPFAPVVVSGDRLKAAKFILDYEARRDSQGRLAVYPLPKGDGGGTFEVAGINDRYHPEEAAELAALIRAGQHAKAEERALIIIANYTDIVSAWHKSPAVTFFLRDCCFNRGPSGAARIYQRALGVRTDASVGTVTLASGEKASADTLLPKLRAAREWYERIYAHRDEKSKFWKGLKNRWDKALEQARKIEKGSQ